MGYMHINDFLKEIEHAIKERVEKQKKVRFVSESSNSKEKQNINPAKISYADAVKNRQSHSIPIMINDKRKDLR